VALKGEDRDLELCTATVPFAGWPVWASSRAYYVRKSERGTIPFAREPRYGAPAELGSCSLSGGSQLFRSAVTHSQHFLGFPLPGGTRGRPSGFRFPLVVLTPGAATSQPRVPRPWYVRGGNWQGRGRGAASRVSSDNYPGPAVGKEEDRREKLLGGHISVSIRSITRTVLGQNGGT